MVLDPVPSEEKESRVSESIRRVSKVASKKKYGRATWDEYLDMLARRPDKFSPGQVSYRDLEGTDRCGICIHFFRQAGDRQRTVCEVMRDGENDIDPLKVCQFFSVDGEEYPLLPKGEKS